MTPKEELQLEKERQQRVVVWSPESLRAALHNALGAEADVENAALCVARGASLEWTDPQQSAVGATVLHIAVSAGGSGGGVEKENAACACVEWLLDEQHVGPDREDLDGSTALHWAAARGGRIGERLVTVLVKRGANPNKVDNEGLTPLHIAANNGNLASFMMLANNYADLNATDASDDESEDEDEDDRDVGAANLKPATRRRTKRGAYGREQRDKHNSRLAATGSSLYIACRGTPLHVACAARRLGIVRQMLTVPDVRARVDIDSTEGPHGSTALHIATRCGYDDIVAVLLANGANVDVADELGETALFRAVEGGHVGIMKTLIDAGADAGATNAAGLSVLHFAACFSRTAMLETLVRAGCSPNAVSDKVYKDWDGARTPMHYAAHAGNVDCFRRLCALGGDMRQLSLVGWPCLFYAIEAGRKELAEWIMERDLEDNKHCVVEKQRTTLMLAAMQGHASIIRSIHDKFPIYLNWCDEDGRTALHWASIRNQDDAIEVLCKLGARREVKDNDGKTPGDLYKGFTRPAPKRMWEEERSGPQGEMMWDYTSVMENTSFRYLRKIAAVSRVREVARERQCNWCQRFTFDARRCGACKQVYYCDSGCQKNDWTHGGHRLVCRTCFIPSNSRAQEFVSKIVSE